MSFPSAREPDEDDLALITLATRTIDSATDADPPESGEGVHTVGAAVRAGDRRAFAGVNLYHFTGGPCAELVALGTARAQGARDIVTIVAVGSGGRGVLAPCGRDRQVLADYHPHCRVIVPTEQGPRSVTVGDLLPGGYRGPDAVDEGGARPELSFAPQYLEAVRAGAKTRTTRREPEAGTGPVELVFDTDPRTRLAATVVRVRSTLASDLTEEDAHAEQCASPADLVELLRTHYPDLRTNETVWVHEFELEENR